MHLLLQTKQDVERCPTNAALVHNRSVMLVEMLVLFGYDYVFIWLNLFFLTREVMVFDGR